jgi:pimeloyl-ACP methyl ester carboxylesterase
MIPHESFEHRGCRFAYRVRGAGPAVLLIQGVGVHGSGWDPQVEGLSSHFRCITFDNRGIGASQPPGVPLTVEQMAEDALALLDHLRVPAAHLVGHSLGGVVAQAVALQAPARVLSLSLLCTVARGADATRLGARMLWLGIASSVGPRRFRRRAFLRIVTAPGSVPRGEEDRLAAELAPLFGHDLADRPPISMQQLAALRAYDSTPRLRELEGIPTLVVSAAHDLIAPPRHGRRLAAAIPAARFIEVPAAAHGVPIQHADRINQLLLEHLAAAEQSAEASLSRAGC